MYTKYLQYNSAVALKLEHSLLQNKYKQTKSKTKMCFNLFNAKNKLKMTCTYVYVKCKQEHFLYIQHKQYKNSIFSVAYFKKKICCDNFCQKM